MKLTAKAVEPGHGRVAGEGAEDHGVLGQSRPVPGDSVEQMGVASDPPVRAELLEGEVVVDHPHHHRVFGRVRQPGDGCGEVGAKDGELRLAGGPDRHGQAVAEVRDHARFCGAGQGGAKLGDGHPVDPEFVRVLVREAGGLLGVFDDDDSHTTGVARRPNLLGKRVEEATHRRGAPDCSQRHNHVRHFVPRGGFDVGALAQLTAPQREPARLLEQIGSPPPHHIERVFHELGWKPKRLSQECAHGVPARDTPHRAPEPCVAGVLRVSQGEHGVGADADRPKAAEEGPKARLGVVGRHHRREVVVGARGGVHDVDRLEGAVGQRTKERRAGGGSRVEAEPPALEGLLLNRALQVPRLQVGVPIAHVGEEAPAPRSHHADEVVARLTDRGGREPRVEADGLEERREGRRRTVAVPPDASDGIVHDLGERLQTPRPAVVRQQQQVVEGHGHQVRGLQGG